ncbi:helix-turn-helix domain-containing protein [Streptomyces sp. B1866]|uniref:AraC-like ligand-binding domain-containing protein n=1 Tax=Streptomyces sp. B1866 TaxID=3075431 RepID=UPI002890408F|nr:helix-turn-helix domain-containing protein [Streptomyces sp. B1866]MDT3397962.1 helix-turn-helix domain-containing protein [Streptomyces sp. B1866]
MITTRLTTTHLPKADRFPWWYDLTASTLVPVALHSAHAADFRATADVLELGTSRITSMTYQPMTVERTPKLIRRSDPEYYHLALTVQGTVHLSQSGRETAFRTGDLMLYDTCRPFEGLWTAGTGTVARIVAQIPKSLVPARPSLVDRLLATRLPDDCGFRGLLTHFLTHVTAQAHRYQPSDVPRLSGILVDLLAATVADRLDAPAILTPESRQRTRALSIHAYIGRHLGDPGLSPARVAAAHHISLRELHRIFQAQGATVAAYIRRQRLEATRNDLADPRLASLPVHAIAARWGFPRPGDFSRAFRAAYGMPPRDYRHAALRGPADAPR